jgi:hypothetical protein
LPSAAYKLPALMPDIESASPVLRGVQIAQAPPPKSPFASTHVGSPFSDTASPSNSIGNAPTTLGATTPQPPPNRSLDPTTLTSAVLVGPDGSPGPEINPLTGSPENSMSATRQVSWNIAKNTVREYEISETQPSEDDWEYRQGNCCCSIQ